MTYSGANTDIHYGQRFADNYEFLTNTSLDTLKRHGNLLVSLDRFEKALGNIAKIKFRKKLGHIFSEEKVSNREQTLLGACVKELLAECGRVSGYKLTYRFCLPTVFSEATTVIFERVIGDTDGDQ